MVDTTRQSQQSPFSNMLRRSVDAMMRQMMFCMPGRIMAFDSSTQLAQVECGIRKVVSGQGRTIPVIESVPVLFSGDNQWYFYHQITPGETEGLIHFSQRAIDTWLDQGGPATPHDLRMLSAEDAFFVPGFRSRTRVIPDLPTSGAGISNYGENVQIQVDDGAITLRVGGQTLVLSSSGLTHNGTNVGDSHTHGAGSLVDGDMDPVTGETDSPS